MEQEMKKNKEQTVLDLAIVMISSIVVISVWCRYGYNSFIADDNREQWYPVIETVMKQWLQTGHMPAFDFFQGKGLEIAPQGSYGVTNPMMILGYLLNQLCPVKSSAMAIYFILNFTFGNMAMYLLTKSMKCSRGMRFLAVLVYSSCGAYMAFMYWYYIIVSYFIVPLLFYVMNKDVGTKKVYVSAGCVLAFSLYLGNVQYTFMHYLSYSVVMLVLALLKHKDAMKIYMCNIFVGIFLSIPLFGLLLGASGHFQQNQFLDAWVAAYQLIGNALIPRGIVKLKEGVLYDILCTQHGNRTDETLYYGAAVFIPMFILGLKWLINTVKEYRIRKRSIIATGEKLDLNKVGRECYRIMCHKDYVGKMGMSFLVLTILWIDYIQSGTIAYILSVCPVVNHFRFLFKGIFVLVPVAAICVCYYVDKQSIKLKKICCALMVVAGIVGLVNNYYVYDVCYSVFGKDYNKVKVSEEVESARERIEDYNMNLKDYRVTAFLGMEVLRHEQSIFDYENLLNRNFPTMLGIYTLAGEDVAIPESTLKQYDSIYSSEDWQTAYGNSGQLWYLYQSLQDDTEKTCQQLIDNSVKYLILECDSKTGRVKYYSDDVYENKRDYITEITKLINGTQDLKVSRVCPYEEKYTLMELEGVNPLCRNQKNQKVHMKSEGIDALTFTVEEGESYELSFAYNKHLKAKGEDGQVLELRESEKGMLVLETGDYSGKVKIYYGNKMVYATWVFMLVTTIAFLIQLFVPVNQVPWHKEKTKMKEKRKDE